MVSMNMEGSESGFVGGIIAVILTGAILSVIVSGGSAFSKLAWVIYQIGMAGISFALLNEALDSSNSDTLRAGLVIAGALVLVFGIRIL
ncbi:hypothetical protein [Thermococcus sp.]